ncbi:hypothetical protein JOC78_002514 [Bacillus ectoiniformans]|nr:hypothetical protein [Bacillus ectoiniformans]
MDKILPVFASIGVGIATYQMLSGNQSGAKNMLPLASSVMGMANGMQGQNQQPLGNNSSF